MFSKHLFLLTHLQFLNILDFWNACYIYFLLVFPGYYLVIPFIITSCSLQNVFSLGLLKFWFILTYKTSWPWKYSSTLKCSFVNLSCSTKPFKRWVGWEGKPVRRKQKFWGYLFSNCICLCGGLTLGSSQAPTQPLAPPSLEQWGGNRRKTKRQVNQVSGSVEGKAKAVRASKAK